MASQGVDIRYRVTGGRAAARDAEGVAKGMRRVGDSATRSRKGLGLLGRTVVGLGTSGAFAGLGLAAKTAFGAFQDSEKVSRQTDAVLRSTGGAANVTAGQVSKLATALSNKTGIDDEAIQSGQNLLLTFTNLRNAAGKGNDIFTQSSRVLTDMSAALGQDTKSSAIQLGKALNDPVKGVTALQRVGVSFTADQRKQIETLVKSGKTVQAQKLILRELRKEFGGSAAANATSTAKLKVALGNLQENVGRLLAPAITKAAVTLRRFVDGMNSGTGAGGRFVTRLRAVAGVVGSIIGFFRRNRAALNALVIGLGAATAAWAAFRIATLLSNLALAANPVGLAVAAIAALAAGLFIAYRRSETFRKVVQTAFKAVELYTWPLRTAFQGVLDIVTAIVDAIGKIKVPGILKKAGGLLGKISPFASGGVTKPGGVSLVGEGGPELAQFPGGTRITPLPLGAGAMALRAEAPVVFQLDGKTIGRSVVKVAADSRARR